jgi:glycosyltransferase involved in cell wall biosynthesis
MADLTFGGLRGWISRGRAWVRGLPRLPRSVGRGLSARGGGPPAVHYGFERIPRRDELIHGGMTKLQALAERHPDTARRFNLVYLVSSAVPVHARALVWSARRRQARLVWNQNGVAYPGWQPAGWKAVNAPLAALLRQADHIFYQSAFCKRAADEFLGPAAGRWEVLHNAVDTRRFVPAASDPAPGRVVMLLGGNQDQRYRVETAIDVLARVVAKGADASLLVTGRLRWADEGDARRVLLARARDQRVAERIQWLGPYTQLEAPSLFTRAHLLLHTKYNDPCPGLVVEALACGLPVVHSASGGVPELVGPGAGIGVPAPEDWTRDHPPAPEAMAEAVLRVMVDRAGFAAAARRRAVEALDVEHWLRRHDEVFAQLTGAAP